MRRTVLLCLALAAAGCTPPAKDRFPGAPVVLVSIDTLRADHLPAYGYAGVQTPHLDRFQKDAMLFENAYTHVPLTLPAHVSILTGLLPFEHGVRDNLGYRFEAQSHPTLPALLKAKGYATGAAVSAYMLRAGTGIADGFDFYDDKMVAPFGTDAPGRVQRPGAETAAIASRWLDGVKGQRANTDDGERGYDALQFQAGFRPASRWNVQGHYTLQLKNDGNQEGEAANQPGSPSFFSGFYPEIFSEARTFPIGRLDDFQRHRVRAWTTYDLGIGRAGTINLGLLYRFDSGTAYSIRSTGQALTAVQQTIGSALYPDLPQSQTIYYSQGRGSEFFEDAHLFDLAVTYTVPIVKRLRPWVKAEVRNMFNATPLISFNTTTRPDPASPRDALGIPTGFIKGSAFGTGTATANYPFPREFLISTGIRF